MSKLVGVGLIAGAAYVSYNRLRKPEPLKVSYADAPNKILIVGGGFGGLAAARELTRTLGGSEDVGVALLDRVSDETHLIVSEPLGDLEGAWNDVPEASCVIVGDGTAEIVPFIPPRSSRWQRPAHLAGSWPA